MRTEEDILEIALKLEDGFTSRDMREHMAARGYPTDTNTIPAKLNELHAAQQLFFLKKREGRFYRYYHHTYRTKFDLCERHDLPLFQDSWVGMADELATALLLSVQGLLSKNTAVELLNQYNKMRDNDDE